MRTNRKRYIAKRRQQRKRLILTICCLCLVLYGSVRLFEFCGNTIRTYRINEDINRDYTQVEVFDEEESEYLSLQDEQSVTSGVLDIGLQISEVVEDASGDFSLEALSSSENNKLLQEYQVIGNTVQESMRKLYQRNNDLRGWLSIKGVLYLPVVYRDNLYYLNHDFDGRKSKAGTLFLDQNHPFKAKTQHLIIHGHDMVDGSMFGLLIHYRNIRYIYEHGIISFNTLFKDEKYVVYAVLVVSENINSTKFFPYIGTSVFSSENEFYYFINQAKKRSLFDIPINVEPSDALLTLSTCLDNDRVLVMFRRIRGGEDEEELSNILLTTKKA